MADDLAKAPAKVQFDMCRDYFKYTIHQMQEHDEAFHYLLHGSLPPQSDPNFPPDPPSSPTLSPHEACTRAKFDEHQRELSKFRGEHEWSRHFARVEAYLTPPHPVQDRNLKRTLKMFVHACYTPLLTRILTMMRIWKDQGFSYRSRQPANIGAGEVLWARRIPDGNPLWARRENPGPFEVDVENGIRPSTLLDCVCHCLATLDIFCTYAEQDLKTAHDLFPLMRDLMEMILELAGQIQSENLSPVSLAEGWISCGENCFNLGLVGKDFVYLAKLHNMEYETKYFVYHNSLQMQTMLPVQAQNTLPEPSSAGSSAHSMVNVPLQEPAYFAQNTWLQTQNMLQQPSSAGSSSQSTANVPSQELAYSVHNAPFQAQNMLRQPSSASSSSQYTANASSHESESKTSTPNTSVDEGKPRFSECQPQ